MSVKNAAYWKEQLRLEQHVEGGAYRRTYASPLTAPQNVLPAVFKGTRDLSSAIFFLLEQGDFSALHRLHSDEMWHFYSGCTLTICEISKDGRLIVHKLGNDPDKGETFQVLIPSGSWFGSKVEEPEGFALVGCTVTPGFDFEDFELAERGDLIRKYPQYADIITSLTRL
jgi:predicted cupin superfamily sugar epimerase